MAPQYRMHIWQTCRSVDIVAFDEKHFHSSFNSQTDISEGQEISSKYFCDVKQGGPESVGQYEDRTLLLMWPDYMGFGAYGLQCLQHYKGQKLILIGEWKNSTFGSYSKGVSEHGQSFSLEFQNKVEDEEVQKIVWVNYRGLTGIMISIGNHPKIVF